MDNLYSSEKIFTVPIFEAYVIYTGNRKLPEVISLKDFQPKDGDGDSSLNIKLHMVTFKNAKDMVKQYIEFSKLETTYYTSGKRSKSDVIDLINFCIKNNILKEYMLKHRGEVINMIENYFTEERRIQGLINDALLEERLKTQKELDKLKAESKKNEDRLLAQSMKKDKLLAENKRELEKERAESKKNEERMRIKEIIHLSELNASPERIAEITDFPIELINKVLEENEINH